VTIGFCIYAFEGIGIVMPIMQSCAEPKKIITILEAAIATLTGVFLVFGTLCYVAYGSDLQPIVTENLPPASPVTITFKLLFSFNVIFGYSITIAPANKIFENWIFGRRQKTKALYWAKNISRLFICLSATVIATELATKIDKFIGLLGALCCAPLALTLPALLHLKSLAKTRTEKAIDISLIAISAVILVFSTSQSIINW
jgi:solute carrier family 36 (proton-coupled amino acid transporter)